MGPVGSCAQGTATIAEQHRTIRLRSKTLKSLIRSVPAQAVLLVLAGPEPHITVVQSEAIAGGKLPGDVHIAIDLYVAVESVVRIEPGDRRGRASAQDQAVKTRSSG